MKILVIAMVYDFYAYISYVNLPCVIKVSFINWDKSALLAPVDKYFALKTRRSIQVSKYRTIPKEGKPLKTFGRAFFINLYLNIKIVQLKL